MRDGHLQLHRESKYMQEEEERSKRGMMATWRERRAATESERARTRVEEREGGREEHKATHYRESSGAVDEMTDNDYHDMRLIERQYKIF